MITGLMKLLRGATPVDPAAGRASQWIAACEELVIAGDIAALRRHLPVLYAAFPHLGYLSSMCRVITNVPEPAANRPDFRDDRTLAIQVSPCPGSDTVMLCFCGASDRLGLGISLMHAWLSHLPVHLVYLRGYWPVRIAGRTYAGADPEAALATLRQIVDDLDAREVLCWGHSLGGYSALLYGLELRAHAVVAFAPKTNLDPASNPFARATYDGGDLKPAYLAAETPPAACIVYAPAHDEDNYHAGHFGDVPHTELWPVPDADGHNVLGEIITAGKLERLMDWVLHAGRTDVERAA